MCAGAFRNRKNGRSHVIVRDVAAEKPRKYKQSDRLFEVRPTGAVPGRDIDVTREIAHGAASKNANLAVHETFEAAAQLLRERKREFARRPDNTRSLA